MTHKSVTHDTPEPPVKPRTVVFDLFGDHLRYLDGGAGPGSVRLQALVELLEVFGVGENTTRVVLARVRREGWFSSTREGRQTSYALTDRAWALLDDGRTRIFDRRTGPWDGAWRMAIYAVPEADRAERETLRRTLAWHGFGPLAASTWVSPHDRLDELAAALSGLGSTRLDLLTCRSTGPAADREMAARCWDLPGLGADYTRLVAELDAVPEPSDDADALRRQVGLLARYRTFPFRDPDLPPELLPESWPGARAHELFTATHDRLHARAGAHVRRVVARHG